MTNCSLHNTLIITHIMTNKVIMRVKVNDDPDSHKDSDDNCPQADNDNPHHNNHSKKLMMMTTTK